MAFFLALFVQNRIKNGIFGIHIVKSLLQSIECVAVATQKKFPFFFFKGCNDKCAWHEKREMKACQPKVLMFLFLFNYCAPMKIQPQSKRELKKNNNKLIHIKISIEM